MNNLLALNLIILAVIGLFSYLRIKKLKMLLSAETYRGDLVGRKEFFETLIDSVADPIFVKDSQHKWIYGNQAFSRLFGRDSKEYIGKTDHDFFPQKMADAFWATDQQTFDSFKTVETQQQIYVQGEPRIIITKKTPLRAMDGGLLLIGVVRDMTEGIQKNETITNLYELIESSSDLYCFCDLKGKPSFVNRHGIKLGFTNTFDHFRNYFQTGFDLKSMQEKLERSYSWEGEVTLINLITNQPIPYLVKIFYVLDANDKPKSICLVGTDIQIRKETELKMFSASKMASLGEMAGGIAHEINNPLAIISGKAEQIKKLVFKEPLNREKIILGVEKIEETAFRISKIIRGLKSISRSGELDPLKLVSIKEIIEETLDLCRERMQSEGITLIQQVDSSLNLTCRSTEIEQVLINLLNNSTDAVKTQKEPWIKISTQSTRTQITLTVTDSGKGIPKDILERMMDPFFTTKEVGKGTGLGLSISRRIMESHYGMLVYNQESPYTSFSLIFNT